MKSVQFLSIVTVLMFGWTTDAFVRSTTVSGIPRYRNDYVYVKESQAFIKINSKRKSWFDAKVTCDAEGAKLAVIRTKAEADVIKSYMSAKTNPNIWIGLQDLISEGEFETIDGEPVMNVYNVWEDGEPNEAGDEDCVFFSYTGKSNDKSCNEKFPFICKKDSNTVKYNAECDIYDTDYKPGLSDQCIKFHSKPKTWDEAYSICHSEQAHLAIINSKEEAEFYAKEMTKYPEVTLKGNFDKKIIHVGFHDKFTEGEYVTIDGKPLSESGFDQWDQGYFFGLKQPDNLNNEDCGSMFRSGLLNDVGCKVRGMFICEKNLNNDIDISLNARISKK